MLPRPRTAEPFVTTATRLPREVRFLAASGLAAIAVQATATAADRRKRQIPLICHALGGDEKNLYPAPDDYGIRSRRNQFPIDVGLSFLAKLVLDIAGAPKLTRKLTGISVSRHLPFLAFLKPESLRSVDCDINESGKMLARSLQVLTQAQLGD